MWGLRRYRGRLSVWQARDWSTVKSVCQGSYNQNNSNFQWLSSSLERSPSRYDQTPARNLLSGSRNRRSWVCRLLSQDLFLCSLLYGARSFYFAAGDRYLQRSDSTDEASRYALLEWAVSTSCFELAGSIRSSLPNYGGRVQRRNDFAAASWGKCCLHLDAFLLLQATAFLFIWRLCPGLAFRGQSRTVFSRSRGSEHYSHLLFLSIPDSPRPNSRSSTRGSSSFIWKSCPKSGQAQKVGVPFTR